MSPTDERGHTLAVPDMFVELIMPGGGIILQAEVNQELCISCGACIDVCPEVFDWNDEEKAQAIMEEVPDELGNQASEAAESCPTDAILIN